MSIQSRVALVSVFVALVGSTGCTGESAEDVSRAAIRRTVEVGRGVGAGVAEGAREGRESQDSIDGAHVVGDHAQLAEHGSVAVSSTSEANGETIVTLVFANDTEHPLRIAHLGEDGALLVLDGDAVTHEPVGRSPVGDLTVHPRSRQTLEVRFDIALADVSAVRVWGQDVALPAS